MRSPIVFGLAAPVPVVGLILIGNHPIRGCGERSCSTASLTAQCNTHSYAGKTATPTAPPAKIEDNRTESAQRPGRKRIVCEPLPHRVANVTVVKQCYQRDLSAVSALQNIRSAP
jgi:hypothetical protein